MQAFSALIIPALGQSWRALQPERLDQYELGVRHAFDAATSVAVTLFRNEGRDRYVIVPPPPPPPRYLNLESYHTEGLEAEVQSALTPTVAVFGGVALLATSPGDLPYAPKSTFTGGLNWQLAPGWFLSADGVYVSSQRIESNARTAGALNARAVGAHFLLNARLAYRFAWGERAGRPAAASAVAAPAAHRGEIYLSAENLTDRQFAYRPGYPIPGANALAGVRFEW